MKTGKYSFTKETEMNKFLKRVDEAGLDFDIDTTEYGWQVTVF